MVLFYGLYSYIYFRETKGEADALFPQLFAHLFKEYLRMSRFFGRGTELCSSVELKFP